VVVETYADVIVRVSVSVVASMGQFWTQKSEEDLHDRTWSSFDARDCLRWQCGSGYYCLRGSCGNRGYRSDGRR
jgi:hypothetical protein